MLNNRALLWIPVIALYLMSAFILYRYYPDLVFPWIANHYQRSGFSWPHVSGKFFSTLIFTASIAHLFGVLADAFIFGWPKYLGASKSEIKFLALRSAVVMLIAWVATGLYGQQLGYAGIPNYNGFISLTLAAFLLSGYTHAVNDLIGSVYTYFKITK